MPGRDPTRQDEMIESIIEKYRKDYGDVFRRVSEREDTRRTPFGCFHIDRLLGGGIPANRSTLICAPESSYKTTFALKAIKNYFQRCSSCIQLKELCQCGNQQEKKAVYICVEPLDDSYVNRLRIDKSRIWIANTGRGYAELACNCAKDFAQSDEVGFIVLDSIAALLPTDEAESGYFDSISQSLRARLVARSMREINAFINRPESCCFMIWINHLLPARPPAYGWILPGGQEQKYYAWVRLQLWKAGKSDTKMTFKKDGEGNEEKASDKQLMGFLIEKSKVGRDNAGGEFDFYLKDDPEIQVEWGDVEEFPMLWNLGLRYGLIEKDGSKILYGEEKFTTQKELRAYLLSRPVAMEQLKQRIMQASGS